MGVINNENCGKIDIILGGYATPIYDLACITEEYKRLLSVYRDTKKYFIEQYMPVKDYKTYADVITVVLNEKHLNAFNKLGLDVNLIIEKNNRYEIVDISKRNSPDERFNLLWYKERESLFKGLSGNSKYSLTQKTQRLRKSDLDLNRLTALVLEDRYKNVSDICRGNSIEMFKKREFAPSNKNLLHFGFNFSL